MALSPYANRHSKAQAANFESTPELLDLHGLAKWGAPSRAVADTLAKEVLAPSDNNARVPDPIYLQCDKFSAAVL